MPIHLIPSIDLRAGKVVRLRQGDYARQIDYDVDPVAVARAYADAGAAYLHVVDLDGARAGAVAQADAIGRIVRSTGLTASVGGGVRSTADVDALLAAGASRVVVGTKAVEDWPWFEALAADDAYAGRLILAVDAKDGLVATKAWTETSTLRAVDLAARVRGWPLAGLLYTDVARDGMMGGPNVARTVELAGATDVPVIASGGVGNAAHVEALARLPGSPVWGVVVGRSLYEGTLTIEDALRASRASA